MNNREIFFACPIGKENSDIRQHADKVLKHLIEETTDRYSEFSEIQVVRADKVTQPGKITTQIVKYLVNADVVIADLTNHNPNVLYEVGIRQAILKPYILIAKSGTELPFDLKDSRTIFYDTSDLDSMKQAREDLKKYLTLALNGNIDPYDQELFGSSRNLDNGKQNESKELRLMETLDGIIEAERKTSKAVDDLSHRLSKNFNEIQSLFTTGYAGAGSYLYISGEHEAFSALVAALSRARESVKTTRYSPFAVGTRQREFSKMILSRVIGDNQYQPLLYFSRIVALNDISKLEDIKQYLNEFIGKQFTLFLTPYSNNFELVIIDAKEVFIHFHGRDKIIDSTLHIIGEKVAERFLEIYSALHDPTLNPNIKKYDFKYISKNQSEKIFDEIETHFKKNCPSNETLKNPINKGRKAD